jgi:transposase-like protein
LCKHINAVEYWLKVREQLNQQQVFSENSFGCVFCNSNKVVKFGNRKGKHQVKQRFKCKDCGKTFILNKSFERLKAEPKAITLCMDLYFKGLSLRKIKDTLEQFYSIKVHHETIRRWVNHFMKQINDYVADFKPNTSSQWHTDEMCIKDKGKWVWVWNTLDRDTRFLLASSVSKSRFVKDAKKHFLEAKRVAQGKPEFVITDGLKAYHKGFNKVFYSNKLDCRHIQLKDFQTKPNNNLVERFHGSLRERTKVVRGYKGQSKQQVKNWQTYYNFIREHQGINTTPAEQSGIKLQLNNNKWLEIIKQSNNNKYEQKKVMVKRNE